MLYRFFECGIYDNDREPSTTVWIEAFSEQDAGARVSAALSLIRRVDPDKICVQGTGTSEVDVLANAIEDVTAGDRRLWATGSYGDRPTYYPSATLLLASSAQRRRLQVAHAAAQAHARELHSIVMLQVTAYQGAGDAWRAESLAGDAQQYLEFATTPLI
ncbi:hypothetical protein JWH16_04590 [Xanthomonas campestris pv. campestris]|uniref:hypothetical protein n=1 Tax=Xanthomonas campestris TaxID=339 RepID=UPI001E5CDAC6|nr:hypothetical protein [Xanthomonas campestris]MCD0253133.1 hypothetical protein [Xanthomonas campestris pv. campestris]